MKAICTVRNHPFRVLTRLPQTSFPPPILDFSRVELKVRTLRGAAGSARRR